MILSGLWFYPVDNFIRLMILSGGLFSLVDLLFVWSFCPVNYFIWWIILPAGSWSFYLGDADHFTWRIRNILYCGSGSFYTEDQINLHGGSKSFYSVVSDHLCGVSGSIYLGGSGTFYIVDPDHFILRIRLINMADPNHSTGSGVFHPMDQEHFTRRIRIV